MKENKKRKLALVGRTVKNKGLGKCSDGQLVGKCGWQVALASSIGMISDDQDWVKAM